MSFTILKCNALKKVDLAVYGGEVADVDTRFGPVLVRKALTPGYCAEKAHEADELSDTVAYGATPAMALLNLCEVLKRDHEAAKSENVLEFVQAAAG